MNKNKIIMAVIGGVAGLAAIGFGAMVYLETDERDTIETDLDGQTARCANNASASEATVKAHRDNEKIMRNWGDESFAYAESMGQRKIDPDQAPAAFKQQMVDTTRELMKIPAGSEKKIIKETFDFGERFKAYVASGEIPAAADMPSLQRQWDDVMHLTDIFVKYGATELLSVAVVPKSEVPQTTQRGRPKQKVVKNPYPSSEETYKIEFSAKQKQLVDILNAIATDERFMSIDTLSFSQTGDPLAQMVGGGDKEKSEERPGRRRSRKRPAELEAEAGAESDEDVARKGLVTNPETCEPFTVSIQITTFDFAEKEEDGK